MNIAIYIYENAEVLDFSGPFEVFSTASRLSGSANLFNVFLIAEAKNPVTARGGFSVNPRHGFDVHPVIDLLIVAGGSHANELKKVQVIRWISQVAKSAQIVASVCTGAFLLAEAGLLSGLKATTHWEDINDLQVSYPDLTLVKSQRWVDEGKIVTSAGISAGIDMSLHLVSRLATRELAEKTARQMEFDWSNNS